MVSIDPAYLHGSTASNRLLQLHRWRQSKGFGTGGSAYIRAPYAVCISRIPLYWLNLTVCGISATLWAIVTTTWLPMTLQLQYPERNMTVVTSARLRLAVNGSFPEFDNRFGGGLMKQFGERSVLTERRRALVGDIAGARRPINFLQAVPSGRNNVSYLHNAPSYRRRNNMHKLRRLERKVLYVRSLRETLWSFLTGFYRWNPFHSYGDQLRCTGR